MSEARAAAARPFWSTGHSGLAEKFHETAWCDRQSLIECVEDRRLRVLAR